MGLETTPEIISDEEKRIGSKIPDIIKSMLLWDNGGAQFETSRTNDDIWHLYAVKDSRSRKHIVRSANYIERETRSARKWYEFPQDGIALGANGCGDYLIMHVGSTDLFVWRHENGEEEETTINPL